MHDTAMTTAAKDALRAKMNFDNSDQAATAVLDYLQRFVEMDLWMLTRVQAESDRWIVLQAADNAFGVGSGLVLKWSDSFCINMVAGRGPRAAADAKSVPAYANAPIQQQIDIGSYMGVPIVQPDGTLFGTLCGVSPVVKSKEMEEKLPMVEMFARLLATILSQEIAANELQRETEHQRVQAMRDILTDTYNRAGFEELKQAEEHRCRRYGNDACAIMIDLNGLKTVNDTRGHHVGDELIIRAAQTIKNTVRPSDIVGRLGGDEFVVIAVECDAKDCEKLVGRLRETFAAADVSAAVGFALRDPKTDLDATLRAADERMYEDKRLTRAERQLA